MYQEVIRRKGSFIKHQALTIIKNIQKREKSHALQGTEPTLAADTAAVITLNLVLDNQQAQTLHHGRVFCSFTGTNCCVQSGSVDI